MGEDLSQALKQISGFLSQGNAEENLKGILSLLSSASTNTSNTSSNTNNTTDNDNERASNASSAAKTTHHTGNDIDMDNVPKANPLSNIQIQDLISAFQLLSHTSQAGSNSAIPNSSPSSPSSPVSVSSQTQGDKSSNLQNLSLLSKLISASEKARSNDDPRLTLLQAIRPFLNNKRKERLGICFTIIQLLNIVKFLENTDHI